jgi:hypothetical protein
MGGKREHFDWSIGASAAWVEHFSRSLSREDIVRGDTNILLPEVERDAIASSVQEFQLGESSEGRHLISAANRYAADSGDFDYVTALRLFIAEENRHAKELGRFLDLAGIPRVGHSMTDTVFRFMRRRAGLELSIAVLVTAEIIAKVYYAALCDATGSRTLQHLCTQILRDERHHVIFQAQRIALLRAGRSRWSIFVRVALHKLLLAGTCVIVWRRHGRAMRGGGMRFVQFWKLTWREMHRAVADMDPANYPALSTKSAKPRSGESRAACRLSAANAAHPTPDLLQLTSEDVT